MSGLLKNVKRFYSLLRLVHCCCFNINSFNSFVLDSSSLCFVSHIYIYIKRCKIREQIIYYIHSFMST